MSTKFVRLKGLKCAFILPAMATTFRSAASFYYSEEDEARPEDQERLKRPIQMPPAEPSTFSHAFLLRQYCAISSDGASTMLTRVVMTVQDTSQDYCKALSELANLYEDSAIALSEEGAGRMTRLTQTCAELRKVVNDLELLFHFVRKLMDSNAEVCFLVGAEFASVQASERLHAAQKVVLELFEKAKLLELEVAKTQRDHIERTAKPLERSDQEEEPSLAQ